MNTVTQTRDALRARQVRTIFLILALLTSPALCCGGIQLLDALPSAWLPSSLGFVVDLFEGSARVENNTSDTLYITAITTTYGDPRIIPQNIGWRQRDIPVRSQNSVVLQYDSADLPLSGIVVCRNAQDCRLLPADRLDIYEINSYESLENLEPSWQEALQASPLHNFGSLLIVGLSLLSIGLFAGWVYLNRREKKAAS